MRETTVAVRERIARLEAEVEALREHVPSTEFVRDMVTGARKSLEQQIVDLPSADKIDAIVTDVNLLATKESVARLRERLDGLGIPKLWQLLAAAVAMLVIVGGIVWKAHDEVSNLDKKIALVELAAKALETRVAAQDGLILTLVTRAVGGVGGKSP